MEKRLPFLLLLPLFLLTGCNDFFECITNKRPQIHNTDFRRGEVGVYYYAEVTTEIKNEPRDDDYGYYYELYGELPVGMQMFVNYRTVSFEGVPEIPGRYTFTLGLFVDPPIDGDGFEQVMCEDYTSRDFSILIEE